MPLTDTEVDNIRAELPQMPEGSAKQEATNLYVGHFYDPAKAARFYENLPKGVAASRELLQQTEKALVVGNRNLYPQKGHQHRQSVNWRGYNYPEVRGMRSKRAHRSAQVLRLEAQRNVFIAAILSRMNNKLMNYAGFVLPQQNELLARREGWTILHKGKATHMALSDDELRERQFIENFIRYGGDAPRFSWAEKTSIYYDRPTFANLLTARLFDRFTLDMVVTELNWSRGKSALKGIYYVDPASIWFTARPDEVGALPELDGNKFPYAQVIDGVVQRLFDPNELMVTVNHPDYSLDGGGYGISEVSMATDLTIGILNVLTDTKARFDRNVIPDQVMVIKGMMGDANSLEVQETWNNYIADPGGGFGIPAFFLPNKESDVEFKRLHRHENDAINSSIISFFGAGVAAVFGEDVAALNMSPHGGQNGGLNSGKDTVARQNESRSTALIPHMTTEERHMNEQYSALLGYKWQFAWTGVDTTDKDFLKDVWMKAATYDEGRGVLGLAPTGGAIGSLPLDNPAMSQMLLAAQTKGLELDKKQDPEVEKALLLLKERGVI